MAFLKLEYPVVSKEKEADLQKCKQALLSKKLEKGE